MRRAAVYASCGATFLATAVLAGIVTAQAAPGFTAARVGQPLNPSPLPAESATTRDAVPITVTEQDVPTGRRTTRVRVATPVGGADVAVVLVGGAGRSDRYAMSAWADQLAARGVAAVSFDKDLTDYSANHRDYPALARDVAEIVVVSRRSTGARRIGVLGFSEGGWVAPYAAAGNPSVDFLVLASPPVVTPLEQVSWIVDRYLSTTPDPVRRVPAAVLAAGRPLINYLATDVHAPLADVRIPILAVWGADDPTVPVVTAVRRLTAAVPGPVTEVVLPAVGHQLDGTRWPTLVADWIRAAAPLAETTVLGVEPATRLGVGTPPILPPYAGPPVQLVVSIAVTALVALRLRRRHPAPPTVRNHHVHV